MYIPKDFNVTDREELLAFIKSNSFGQLISLVEGKPFSSHIPIFFREENQSLICHIAKNNPQWENIEGQEILVTFQGPNDYISPSWYESPGVPTWNYQAIHVYGRATIYTDIDELRFIVDELTERYESSFSTPWKPDYKESLLAAIVGIKIEITEIQGKYKLSQNRPVRDRELAIKELESSGSVSLSKAMKNEL